MTKEETGNDQSVNLARGEIECTKCWSLNPKGNNFCGRCGVRLHIQCPRCGHINERILADCSKCGSRLRQSFWRRWRRKLFSRNAHYELVDKLVPVFLVIVVGLLIAWVVSRMGGDGQ